MAMPTTRRGRYLFYKARAMRRLRRARRRVGYEDTPTGTRMHRSGTRTIDLSDFTKQVISSDYHPKVVSRQPGEGTVWPYFIEPARGQWAILFTPPLFKPLSPTWHRSFAYYGYAQRRVISIPRLRHLPRLPYATPFNADVHNKYYPLETYPSGQPNPHWPYAV